MPMKIAILELLKNIKTLTDPKNNFNADSIS